MPFQNAYDKVVMPLAQRNYVSDVLITKDNSLLRRMITITVLLSKIQSTLWSLPESYNSYFEYHYSKWFVYHDF